jgi:hypothetical protein
MSRRRRVVAVVAAVAIVAGLALGGAWWWRAAHNSDLEHALSLAPDGAERVSWTAWAEVRRELGTGSDLDALLDQGYDADLTSTSALVESAPLLEADFGWSPANIDWELFAQSESGAAVVVGLPDDTDVDALGDRLEALGYTRPSDDDGVWRGGEEVLAAAAAGRPSSPVLQYVALDADAGVLTTSDNLGYLEGVVDDRGGNDDLAEVVDAVGDPLAASVYLGGYACGALAMSQADAVDQEEARRLIEAAGEVGPMTAYALAVEPGLDLRVAMSFETDERARVNADSRATLAAGPAPGQGGTFPDRFTLGDVVADGTLVTMELAPTEGADVLSDLGSGPVLFATC